MTYTLTSGTSIIRDADGACVPADSANTDYQTYLTWVAAAPYSFGPLPGF